jgi:hypothetical protein
VQTGLAVQWQRDGSGNVSVVLHGSAVPTSIPAVSLSFDQWHFVFLSVEIDSVTALTLWVNGEKDVIFVESNVGFESTVWFSIGQAPLWGREQPFYNSSESLVGAVDEISIWSGTVSSDDVQRLMYEGPFYAVEGGAELQEGWVFGECVGGGSVGVGTAGTVLALLPHAADTPGPGRCSASKTAPCPTPRDSCLTVPLPQFLSCPVSGKCQYPCKGECVDTKKCSYIVGDVIIGDGRDTGACVTISLTVSFPLGIEQSSTEQFIPTKW